MPKNVEQGKLMPESKLGKGTELLEGAVDSPLSSAAKIFAL